MHSTLFTLALFWAVVCAIPFRRRLLSRADESSEIPRLVIYYQTTHDSSGRPISVLPLITEQQIALTHLIVAAFHVHANGTIHLNDYPPEQPLFDTLWNETRILQAAGVKVLGMVGGAAPGSFTAATLDADADAITTATTTPGNRTSTATSPTAAFEAAYALLHNAITTHKLDGIDLDVEQAMSQAGITRLVRRLRADFGAEFVITLAPVASALQGRGAPGRNLSGFSYAALEREAGDAIAFYNTQFYSSFGDLAAPADFERIVAAGWDPRRVVLGQLTSPVHGTGFVPHARLAEVVAGLRKRYGEIGGIMGWEYFNGVPGGAREPWRWAQAMTAILRPGGALKLRITREMAEGLNRTWVSSAMAAAAAVGGGGDRRVRLTPNVDYMAMVNA
ncbi:glycoside hydrolase family 18 protein [Thermothielavioides terrestris NRRL 8126]|uniref:chitinase n=1 Tax=Thermothielavioides terrestris (strain ATCC 38088 / NRRL 8126) TaxID=578455 RepID=G2R5X4_THETT|nr:glycoside hydrolase family 18 protein [Thermothielavioides terrestris NRRL 8126]AEO68361.1 glycoside hydrolase family 18 protein [Thermothielavioides terrestris NRRL 8126]